MIDLEKTEKEEHSWREKLSPRWRWLLACQKSKLYCLLLYCSKHWESSQCLNIGTRSGLVEFLVVVFVTEGEGDCVVLDYTSARAVDRERVWIPRKVEHRKGRLGEGKRRWGKGSKKEERRKGNGKWREGKERVRKGKRGEGREEKEMKRRERESKKGEGRRGKWREGKRGGEEKEREKGKGRRVQRN